MFSAMWQARSVIGVCALGLTAMLSACGGGGDDAVLVDEAPAVSAPGSAAVSDFFTAGNLNYLVSRVNGGSIESVPVAGTVSRSGTFGTLTFDFTPEDLSITTSDDWAGVAWPTGFSGMLYADGNVGMVCDTDPSTTTGQVGVSHNMVKVTDAGALKGKTFSGYNCDGVDYTAVFNTDGTASITDVDGTFNLTASQVTASFSSSGLIFEDGSKVQLVIYKTSSIPTQYFVVDKYTGTGVDGDLSGVQLMVESAKR